MTVAFVEILICNLKRRLCTRSIHKQWGTATEDGIENMTNIQGGGQSLSVISSATVILWIDLTEFENHWSTFQTQTPFFHAGLRITRAHSHRLLLHGKKRCVRSSWSRSYMILDLQYIFSPYITPFGIQFTPYVYTCDQPFIFPGKPINDDLNILVSDYIGAILLRKPYAVCIWATGGCFLRETM